MSGLAPPLIRTVQGDHKRMTREFPMKQRCISIVLHGWVAMVMAMALLASPAVAEDKANLDEQLRVAAENGDLALVKSLVKKGADLHAETAEGVTLLVCAAIGGNLELVKYLVEQGLDVNAKTVNTNFSVLVWPSCAGNLDVVQFLVQHGADINARDSRGNSVLDSAKLWKQTEIVKYLESQGAK